MINYRFKIYTQAVCPKCRVLKKMLEDRNINYTECTDIEKLKDLGFTSTPVLETEEGIMMDFTTAVKYIKNIK